MPEDYSMLDHIPRKISEDDNEKLSRTPEMNEVKKAVLHLIKIVP